MQEFGPISNSVQNKRQGLMRDIQNIARDSIKKRARSEMITFLSRQELNEIIESAENSINSQQLAKLIKYVNNQFPKAIALLGNLIIDDKIKISQLQKFCLKVGYHPYWLWLIEVMVQKEYCTLNLVQHCIHSISPARSQQTVSRALSVLYKISSSTLHSPLLLRDQQALLQIFNAALRSDSSSQYAFLLIYQLIKRSGEEIKQRFESGILRQKMINILIHGSLKLESRPKHFTCKILTQLIKRGVYFTQLIEVQISLFKSVSEEQDQFIILEFFAQFMNRGSIDDILSMLNLGLIIEMAALKDAAVKYEKDELHGKIILLARQLNEKVSNLPYLSKGVHRQLQKYSLLTFSNKLQLC